MGALWKELANWRRSQYWNTRKFFEALFLSPLFTLLDTGTDFAFAESVPYECPGERWAIHNRSIGMCQNPEKYEQTRIYIGFQNHCGFFASKGVKFFTYTCIALPGIVLSFSALQTWNKFFGAKHQGCLHAATLFLQMALCTGLGLVPQFWGTIETLRLCYPALDPVIEGYEAAIRVMAYISATIVVGLKLLGTVCHGPEVTRMVERATSAEAQFEASLQLILLGSIYLVSGNGSSESRSSAITSLLVIKKVGVQNFFKKHDKELSKASLLGRICIAASISPAFVLVAFYKIGSLACVATVDTGNYIDVLRSVSTHAPLSDNPTACSRHLPRQERSHCCLHRPGSVFRGGLPALLARSSICLPFFLIFILTQASK